MTNDHYTQIMNQQMVQAKTDIANFLPDAREIPLQDVASILGTYGVAVEHNFIPWMQLAYTTSKSPIAKEVILENIDDEISGNHPKMLREFLESSKIQTNQSHYAAAAKPVLDMWKLFGTENSLTQVAVAATLENTSEVFIPYLAAIAKRRGCTNFEYTDVHGEADIIHAEKLMQGTIEEMEYANAPWRTVANAVSATTGFLESILTKR